jgi:hypothetical protein
MSRDVAVVRIAASSTTVRRELHVIDIETLPAFADMGSLIRLNAEQAPARGADRA